MYYILWLTIRYIFSWSIIMRFSTSLQFKLFYWCLYFIFPEAFGRPGMSRTQHVPFSDEPEHYPERFQEPMNPRGYRPAAGEYFDCPSAPLRMAEEPRMQSGSRYSTNLDKITSTLLELVARKQQWDFCRCCVKLISIVWKEYFGVKTWF